MSETGSRTFDLSACQHPSVTYWGAPGGGFGIWACAVCSLRFYPACRVCVNVGHRGVDHVESAALQPAEASDDQEGER